MIHALLGAALAAEPELVLQTARIHLPVGHVLRVTDLTELRLAPRDVPMGVVHDATAVVGREIKVPVFPGEVLRGEYLGAAVDIGINPVPGGHVALELPIKADAEELDLVVLRPGGFCRVAAGVARVPGAPELAAVPLSALVATLQALSADASVRRADPGLRPCR